MPLQLSEARERAALVSDVRTSVHLDLRSTERFTVEAVIAFDCARPGAATFLELTDGVDVLLNGSPAPYDGERIALRDLATSNEVRVSASLPYVTDGDGMTVTVDPADGERYVCAFTAMDVARKVLPCFDQPDLKTTLDVSVTAPQHWTVLANGREAGRAPAADGEGVRWSFAPTPPISSYVFFVAAGPWVSVTWDEPYSEAAGGTLPFGWHARASQRRQLERDADELRRITSSCFQWFTEAFDPPYAFDDYQQVFTPGLNWGAMEFPGCVAFRDEYLVAGTPTELQRQWLATTIAHEMAHMWFGDLVTMRWWEDTWLNESFADFMGFEVGAEAAGYDGAWVTAALTRKTTGYRADRRRSTHPVAEDAERVPDADTAFANFDMITYAKGNATLRQLGTWLGEDFLAGVNRHLRGHAFGNADLAEFLDALDAETDRDVRDWAQRWLRSTGFDAIEVSREGDVPVLTRHGSRQHRFSVAAFEEDMTPVGSAVVDLADTPLRLEQYAGKVVVPNAGDETFAALRWDAPTWAAIRAGLSRVPDPLTRAVLWWSAIDGVESHEVSLEEFAGLLADHLAAERHPVILESVVAAALRVARIYCTPQDVRPFLDVLGGVAESALDSGVPSLVPCATRTLAGTGADPDLVRGFLTEEADPELRWIAVRRLAELGEAEHIEAEEQRDRSVSGHLAALTARAAVATAEAKAATWDRLMGGDLANHEFTAVSAGFWGWEQSDLVAGYLERYLSDGLALAQRSGQGMGQVIGRAVPHLPLPAAERRRLRDAFAATLARDDVPIVLARWWNDGLDDLDRALSAEVAV
ncbi:aminopeptidase N [Nocardioides sambongensis]|uniref:aminopeptidase N n=1 Tax=Nocardioides sambongensis TaxID=2589074 RepID=UPI001128AB8D|nr:aminopeptidase N [Nocardioides sambongensis]